MSSAREPSRTSLHKRGHPGEESLAKPHRTQELWEQVEKLLSSEVHIMWWFQEAQARRWESTFRVWQHYWMSDAGQKAVSRVLLPSHVSEPTRPSRLSQTSPTAASASGPINNLDTGHKVSLPKQLLNRPPTHAEKSARSTSLLQLAGVEVRDKASVHKQCARALFAPGRSVGEVQPAKLRALHWLDFVGLPRSNRDTIRHSFISHPLGRPKLQRRTGSQAASVHRARHVGHAETHIGAMERMVGLVVSIPW